MYATQTRCFLTLDTVATVVDFFVNAICDDLYNEVYGNTAVYLDVKGVVQSVSTVCNVQSLSESFGFNNANNFADLAAR